MLRQPTLFTPHGRSNPQSKAFFTKKRITAVARTKGPNLSGLWVVHDVLAGIVGALAATNYIEILNDRNRLSEVAASAAFIHNSAALLASRDAPITSTQIIGCIPDVIRKIM